MALCLSVLKFICFLVSRKPPASLHSWLSLYWKKSFALKNLISWENFVSLLFVPFARSVLDILSLATWGNPLVTYRHCENCPAFVPYLSTTSLSVREHSLVSHDSTVSLKVFDEGPCQISFGNTNRLYQLKLPYPHACCFLQRTLSKDLWVAVALRVMAKAVLTFTQNTIFFHVSSNSVLSYNLCPFVQEDGYFLFFLFFNFTFYFNFTHWIWHLSQITMGNFQMKQCRQWK